MAPILALNGRIIQRLIVLKEVVSFQAAISLGITTLRTKGKIISAREAAGELTALHLCLP